VKWVSMPDKIESEFPSLFNFSQSSMQDYYDCPRRFQLRYLEQLAWPAMESEPLLENEQRQQDGRTFHRMVQQHVIGLPVQKISRQANRPELNRWWENYLGHDFNIPGYGKYPEIALSAPVGPHRLLAQMDLVAISPARKAIIFDWKTYHKRPMDEWMAVRMQTRVYRALLVRSGGFLNGGVPFLPEQIEIVYWYASFPLEPARFSYDPGQYHRDWVILTGMIDEIDHMHEFPMTMDEKKCVYCPYRSYCERGSKAGMDIDAADERESASGDKALNYEQIAEIEF
jgi:hypothetical protein